MTDVDLHKFEDPRSTLRSWGLQPSRRLSQNFLIQPSVVEQIVAAVPAIDYPDVVELGPGVGTLTGPLLRQRQRLIAVEKDLRFIEKLRERFSSLEQFRVYHGDASFFSKLVDMPAPYALVGNLPYAITGQIIRELCEAHRAVRRAVVMVQHEVAVRLMAASNTAEYGVPTIFVQALFEVRRVCHVRPQAFFPKPKVSSDVILLEPLSVPKATFDKVFQQVVHGAFRQRRKQLRNSLKQFFSVDDIDTALEQVGLTGVERGEALSISQLDQIAANLRHSARKSIL